MKMKFLFMSMLAIATLASCNNDDEIIPSGGVENNGKNAYMALSISMPGAPVTRAMGEDQGTDAERGITSVLLVMFDDNEICLDTMLLASTDYSLIAGTTTTAGEPFLVNGDTKKILTVINPSSKFEAACQKGVAWSVINVAQAESVSSVAADNKFMMINAGDNNKPDTSALIVANVKKIGDPNIDTTEKAKEAAKNDPSKVNVDRVVSKVSLGVNADLKVDNGAVCEFGDWALNVTNKTMYPYSKIVMPIGGSTGADYRIDPNYLKDWEFNTSYFNYLKIVGGALPADFNNAGSKYCLENTMAAEEQTEAQTTTAVTQAVYTPANFTEDQDWFRVLGVTYETLANLQAAYANGTEQLKGLCDAFYASMKKASTDQGKVMNATDFASLTSAELELIKNGGEYSKPATGQTVGVEYFQKGICYYRILIRHDELITGNMAHGKYGVVRNNSYSLIINKVSQPGTPWLPDPTDPTDPGTPDDPKEVYLGVTITVNPWTTWSQGVDL